jgi:signal transduction histidine kinase
MDSIILQNLNVINPVLYVTTAINFIIATIVISRGIRSLINIFFGLLSVSIGLWALAISGFYSNANLDTSFNWVIWTHFFALLTSLSFLYFSFLFPQKIISRKIYYLIPLVPAIIVSYLIFFSDLVIGDTFGIAYKVNKAYNLYALVLLIYFFASYFLLYKQYKKSDTKEKQGQVKYIFIGYSIGSFLASFTDLLLPSVFFNIFNFTWLGPVFSIILVVSILSSMIRYNLFNVKIILSEIFTLSIISLLMVNIFIEGEGTGPLIVKIIILILIVLFSYQFIKSVYQEVKTKEALAVANVQQANLIRFISHEVKGALGKSRGFFSLISDGTFGEVPFKLKEMSADVYKTVTKGVEMVEDILNASNIRRGTFSYDKKPFDLKAMVSSVTESFRQTAEEKGLSFNLAIPEGNYLYAGDEKQLSHVIKNLIDNSVRYTTAGSVAVTLEKKTNSFQFKVSDTGFGLSDEDKKNLFTEGGKGKESQKVNVESTGYGLYIVKGIVEAHGGKVWADSPGRSHGSVFTVELPITVEAEAKNSAETPTNKSF